MVSLVSAAALTTVLLYVGHTLLCWARNIRIAKASGIPYIIVPYYSMNQITGLLWVMTIHPWLHSLLGPPAVTSWRTILRKNWVWRQKYAPFAAMGSDTFLTVAPGGITMPTVDPDVATQVISRMSDFPKPIHLYSAVDMYGENVVASEGSTWRHHRKLTGSVFSEGNNRLVWKETIDLCQATVASWTSSHTAIRTIARDCARVSLAVIGRAGLGQKIEWNASDGGLIDSDDMPAGHRMTFNESLITLLECLISIMVTPNWLLKHGPMKRLSRPWRSYAEWGQYMREIIAHKRASLSDASGSKGHDLLSQLVLEQQKGARERRPSQKRVGLTDEEIMGNLFVMTVAGHETSANSIHFSMVLLAQHPQVQRQVQEELAVIFQGREDPSLWDYERDLPRLMNSTLALVLHEELRLLPPTLSVPKMSTATPQRVTINGTDCTVPPGTVVRLTVPGMHRNPKYWPRCDPGDDDDLDTFKPSRWLNRDGSPFVPRKGSYIPFSDGPRACLGKRFAQVEILAALAVLLTRSSVELAVDDWASEEQVEKMSRTERKRVWTLARDQANWNLQNKLGSVITLQLRGGAHVPLRVVTKGDEKFADLFGDAVENGKV